MRLARVTGTVTATAKPDSLGGCTLLLLDIVDGSDGKRKASLQSGVVGVDTCGAGKGDLVIIAEGSAARLSANTSGAPIDCAVIAIVDTVSH